jgi:hypothetical protein
LELIHPLPFHEVFDANTLLAEREKLLERLNAIIDWLTSEAAGEELGARDYENDPLVIEAQLIYDRIASIDLAISKLQTQ